MRRSSATCLRRVAGRNFDFSKSTPRASGQPAKPQQHPGGNRGVLRQRSIVLRFRAKPARHCAKGTAELCFTNLCDQVRRGSLP